MAVIRSDHDKDNPYTTISNDLIQDTRLKPYDLALMVKMLSLPDTWEFSASGLSIALNLERHAVSKSLKRLEGLGYIERPQQERGKGGRFVVQDWTIHETPSRGTFSTTVDTVSPGRNRGNKTVGGTPPAVNIPELNTYIKDVSTNCGNEEGKCLSQAESTTLSESVPQVEDQQSKNPVVGIEGAALIQWRNSSELCPYCGSLVMTNGKSYKCLVCYKSWGSLAELFGTHEDYP